MIEVSGLSKYYGTHRAIERVSFKINEGEIIGLLGLNGAGKSTILKILGCFLLPSGGEAKVGGISVESDPYLVRSMIGYLPDTPPLYEDMSVEAYLRYVAALKNVSARNIDAHVHDALDQTNTREVAQVSISALSHGYRQRVGIAQALVHQPKVLIFDEPINGLDPVQIVEMRDLILGLRGKHTVILSSHILSEITKTCDRIMIVDKGRLVAEGTEESLTRALTQAMRISCTLAATNEKILAAIRAIPGVTAVNAKEDGRQSKLFIDTASDARAAIAAAIVNAGGSLLTLTRDDQDLEGIFMRLVGASGPHSTH